MKNKVIKVIIGILIIFSLMFAEYRFIMWNLRPYIANDNLLHIELFGQYEEYYAERIKLD